MRVPAGDRTILYLGGAPRSGSTILGIALADSARIQPVGEVNELWRDGFLRNLRCSCGDRFRSCPFWRRVARLAFGSLATAEARQLATQAERATGAMWGTQAVPPGLRDALRRLYAALADVSGTRVIVDSSKSAGYARALRNLPGTSLRVIHLVRDSRAVVYSWSRTTLLPRLGVARSCAQWNAYHLPWVALDAGSSLPVRRLRYEDFCADPGESVGAIRAWLSLPGRPSARRTGPVHVLSGNPVRHAGGPPRIAEDDAWKCALPRPSFWLATALTAPLLTLFRYRLRPPPRD